MNALRLSLTSAHPWPISAPMHSASCTRCATRWCLALQCGRRRERRTADEMMTTGLCPVPIAC